jgi:hypothetical protein
MVLNRMEDFQAKEAGAIDATATSLGSNAGAVHVDDLP